MILKKIKNALALFEKMEILIHILLIFLLNLNHLNAQEIPLIDYGGWFVDKVIRLSPRIIQEWQLSDSYLWQFYYDINKEQCVPPNQNFLGAYAIYWDKSAGHYEALELIDDGLHFDNAENDGIFGNVLIGDIGDFLTNEIIFDMRFDPIGVQQRVYQLPVKFVPVQPDILYPKHQSIISSLNPIIQWMIDPKADGCGAILLDNVPSFGEKFREILWQQRYDQKFKSVVSDVIPSRLEHDKIYHLIIWSYVKTKYYKDGWSSGAYSMEWATFSIDTNITMATNFKVFQNFPNPFNSKTIISWAQDKQDWVSLTIYNISGKEVKKIVNQKMSAGMHFVTWDGMDKTGRKVSSGIYFLNVKTQGRCKVIKLTLIN